MVAVLVQNSDLNILVPSVRVGFHNVVARSSTWLLHEVWLANLNESIVHVSSNHLYRVLCTYKAVKLVFHR